MPRSAGPLALLKGQSTSPALWLAGTTSPVELGGAPARALEKVVFGTGAPLTVDYAEIFFGMELGFFRDEGIELSLVGFQGGVVLVPQVINKSVQFGLGASLPGILALAPNKPMPIRVIYDWLRLSYADFAVLENSPIQSLADLKGKRLGIAGFNYATTTITQVTLRRLGIEWQKDVEVLPVGTGSAAWKQLETGQVDACKLNARSLVEVAQVLLNQLTETERFPLGLT